TDRAGLFATGRLPDCRDVRFIKCGRSRSSVEEILMESIVDRTALLKRLREKVLKGVTLAEEGPSVAELFLLMRDLNYLHLQLLRELGRLISADNLPMEVLPSLLEMEGLRADDMARGKTLQGRSDAELLQAAGVLPLICLHRFPSLESLFPEQK